MKPRVQSVGRFLGVSLLLIAGGVSAASKTEFGSPFRVEAHGKPIDMAQGYASPYVMDFDGDGVFDLLMGQRGECKLRIYRNIGTSKDPKFGVSAFFKAGGVDASLPGG